jgi:uncharacterized integral membrane protein (TIGR00698 family)
MSTFRDLEDLAPAAELRPLAPAVDPGRQGAVAAAAQAAGRTAPGLALVAASVAMAYAIARLVPSISPLVASVAIGALLANAGLVPERARAGTHFAGKRLLRVGVVLLGFQLAIGEVLRLGGPGLVVVALVVTITFFGTQWLGRRLGVGPALSLLIATGFSICGASAVAAVEGVTDADEEEVALAIALVTLCGSLAILVLPALGGPLGLHGSRFGAWVGASVHDVAQVVATSSTGGTASLHTAVIVKLTRVVLLAPMIAGITLHRRHHAVHPGSPTADGPTPEADHAARRARTPLLPLFVVGFLSTIALRSAGLVPGGWLVQLKTLETLALAAALVGLGTGVRIAKLRRLGGRPLILAMAAWLLVASVAYVGVLAVGA